MDFMELAQEIRRLRQEKKSVSNKWRSIWVFREQR